MSGSRLWRFRSSLGELVVRAWPDPGPSRPVVEQIHAWVIEASRASPRLAGWLATPIASTDGRTVLEFDGGLWDLSPWMPGESPVAHPPRFGQVEAGFVALAEFHRGLSARVIDAPSPGLAARRDEIESLLGGGFSSLERAILPDGGEVSDLARSWLASARLLAPGALGPLRTASLRSVALQPCLRDVRPDHVLFEGDLVTGIIDYGAMAIESVAADLARLLAEWLGEDVAARDAALGAYREVRNLSGEEAGLIPIFEQSAAILGGARWVRWHFVEGRAFDSADAIRAGLSRAVDRLRRRAPGIVGLRPS